MYDQPKVSFKTLKPSINRHHGCFHESRKQRFIGGLGAPRVVARLYTSNNRFAIAYYVNIITHTCGGDYSSNHFMVTSLFENKRRNAHTTDV